MQERPSPSRSHQSISSMVISLNQDPLDEDPFYGDPQMSDSSLDKEDRSALKPTRRLPEKAPVLTANGPINDNRQETSKTPMPRVLEEPKQKFAGVQEKPKQRMREERAKSPEKIESEHSSYDNIVWRKSRYNETDVCDVCGNADPGEFDGIYICDLCHCTTHQSCYGGDLADRNFMNDLSGK